MNTEEEYPDTFYPSQNFTRADFLWSARLGALAGSLVGIPFLFREVATNTNNPAPRQKEIHGLTFTAVALSVGFALSAGIGEAVTRIQSPAAPPIPVIDMQLSQK